MFFLLQWFEYCRTGFIRPCLNFAHFTQSTMGVFKTMAKVYSYIDCIVFIVSGRIQNQPKQKLSTGGRNRGRANILCFTVNVHELWFYFRYVLVQKHSQHTPANLVSIQSVVPSTGSQLAKFLMADTNVLSSGSSSTAIGSNLADVKVMSSVKGHSRSSTNVALQVNKTSTMSKSASMSKLLATSSSRMASSSSSNLQSSSSMISLIPSSTFQPSTIPGISLDDSLTSLTSLDSMTLPTPFGDDGDEDSQFSLGSSKMDMYLTESDLKAEGRQILYIKPQCNNW